MAEDKKKADKLEARLAELEQALGRKDREIAALQRVAEGHIHHGITAQALANKEKRAELKEATLKKDGLAYYQTTKDRYYDGLVLHPRGAVVAVPEDLDPSVDWLPVESHEAPAVSAIDAARAAAEAAAEEKRKAAGNGKPIALRPPSLPGAAAHPASAMRPSDTSVV